MARSQAHLPWANSRVDCARADREYINGIFYVPRSAARGAAAKRLPPWSTIYRWFAQFRSGSIVCGGQSRLSRSIVSGRGVDPARPVLHRSQSVKTNKFLADDGKAFPEHRAYLAANATRGRRSLVVLVETRCSHEPRPICDDKTLGNTVSCVPVLRWS